MGPEKLRTNLFDLVMAVARIVDVMSPAIGGHHLQVAYLAARIAEEMNLPLEERIELMMAGALHDIGAFSLQDRLDLLEFEEAHPERHALAGYLLLRSFKPFSGLARLVKYHHVDWEKGRGSSRNNETIPRGSHILHLADRVVVQLNRSRPVLSQVAGICATIAKSRNHRFAPEQVDAMLVLAQKDAVWLELTSDFLAGILGRKAYHPYHELSMDEMVVFARFICRLIDFRSNFTATHSSGVASCAKLLAKFIGFSANEIRLMEIAAYLHDLGKLAIPREILEKKTPLDTHEWFVMRAHVYYTHETLAAFESLGIINAWGALHQERLNGSGYPFGYHADELPLGARVMAVADVFTALTENRPYRKGLGRKDALDLLMRMQADGELDPALVKKVTNNFNELNLVRTQAQQAAGQEYDAFRIQEGS